MQFFALDQRELLEHEKSRQQVRHVIRSELATQELEAGEMTQRLQKRHHMIACETILTIPAIEEVQVGEARHLTKKLCGGKFPTQMQRGE